MMKRFYKKENLGITLIALVITIVVLIILAGVIISITLGNGGVIDRAKLAKQEYANAQGKEEKEIAEYDDKIDEYSGFTRAGGSNINYSQNEQDTGLKWIDKKPIYQKTFTGTISSSVTQNIGVNVETVCGFEGYIYKTSQGRIYKFPQLDSFGSSTGYCYLQVYNNSAEASVKNTINIEEVNTSWFNGDTYYVTVQYTKVTN